MMNYLDEYTEGDPTYAEYQESKINPRQMGMNLWNYIFAKSPDFDVRNLREDVVIYSTITEVTGVGKSAEGGTMITTLKTVAVHLPEGGYDVCLLTSSDDKASCITYVENVPEGDLKHAAKLLVARYVMYAYEYDPKEKLYLPTVEASLVGITEEELMELLRRHPEVSSDGRTADWIESLMDEDE